jgi:hypothetical protein
MGANCDVLTCGPYPVGGPGIRVQAGAGDTILYPCARHLLLPGDGGGGL